MLFWDEIGDQLMAGPWKIVAADKKVFLVTPDIPGTVAGTMEFLLNQRCMSALKGHFTSCQVQK